VLDLSSLPPVPCIFDGSRDQRDTLLFLNEFVKSITAPVVHDGREHIDYVPTQILTEYFRRRAAGDDGPAIDGIIYPSSRRRNGRSIVLFASQMDLDPDRQRLCQAPILTFDSSSLKRLRRPRLKKS
jgi:hypothetical protein